MVRLRVERKIKGHDRRCFETFQKWLYRDTGPGGYSKLEEQSSIEGEGVLAISDLNNKTKCV